MKDLYLILSPWRSGTTWISKVLRSDNGELLGSEPQILPFFALLLESCKKKCKNEKAWRPICEVGNSLDESMEQLGYKAQKFFHGHLRSVDETPEEFAYRMVMFMLEGFKSHKIVEKSPQNLSDQVFNFSLSTFSEKSNVKMLYLYREFEQYMASIYYKSIQGATGDWANYDMDWFAEKWVRWNLNACRSLENAPSNLYVADYADLVNDISLLGQMTDDYWKSEVPRQTTLNKWKDCEDIDTIIRLRDKYSKEIQEIYTTNERYKLR